MTIAPIFNRCHLPQGGSPRREVWTCTVWAVLLQLLIACPMAAAQGETAHQRLEKKLDQRGSIMLRDSSLASWLFTIQEVWKVDIVFGDDLRDETVNGVFKNSTLRQVLNAILVSRGYGYEPLGDSLIIKPLDQMGPLKPQFQREIFVLEYLAPQEVEPSVQVLLSPHATVKSIPSSKSLFVADLPERIEAIREHLDHLEDHARAADERQRQQRRREEEEKQRRRQPQPQRGRQGGIGPLQPPAEQEAQEKVEKELVQVFHPQHVKARNLEMTLQAVLGEEGRVNVMEEDNKLILMAPESAMEGAKQLLRQLDIPRAQVRITALLYDVNVEEMERLGFNWSNSAKGRINAAGDPQSFLDVDNSNFRPSGSSSSNPAAGSSSNAGAGSGDAVSTAVSSALGGWLTLSHLSQHFDITAIIQALSTVEGARLLARPNILATDGVEADFSSVSEIPVQQLTQTQQGGNIGTTQFREAGIKLTVTPQVNEDGTIRLELTPEFSVLSGFQDGQPIIDRRSAVTTLLLKDGQTAVIGGLLRRNELENQRALPGSRKWFFGGLFRDHETTITESELLVVVKAEIVSGNHYPLPREVAVQAAVEQHLEEIPYANHGPFLPHCGDPYCPLHNPHLRHGPAGGPMRCGKQPRGSIGWYDEEVGSQGLPASPQAPPSYEVLPLPPSAQHDLPPVEPPAPPPGSDGTASQSESDDSSGPPPVIIDGNAQRTGPPQRTWAVRRLPPVSNPRPQIAARPPSGAREVEDRSNRGRRVPATGPLPNRLPARDSGSTTIVR